MTTASDTAPGPETAAETASQAAPPAMVHRPAPNPAAAPGRGADVAIGLWLLVCAAMVFAIVVIGGITRLTHSGLSMVEWKPLIGILPPLSEAEWQRVFGLYQLSPEYLQVNKGMSLEAFQGIFWWEWFHRLFAQLIGVVFLLPFLFFWLSRRVRPELMPNLIGLFLLGGLQGVVGWLMVASGLVDRPAVSHYRLAAHLTTALLIFSFLLWQALTLLRPEARSAVVAGARAWTLRLHLWLTLLLMLAALVWGALVAGLHAGLIYNTFPLMNGAFIPSEAWDYAPKWLNLFENHTTVQFVHRWLAIATGFLALLYGWRVASIETLAPATRRLGFALGAWVLVQISLGITTLVLSVPVPTAVTHQGGAFVLLTLILWALHDLRRR
ncbi:MAG: COX15/CtaA family protein [Rhodospirillaceae bacterium]